MTHFGGVASAALPEHVQLLAGMDAHGSWAMVHACGGLRKDRDFVLAAVRKDGNALLYARDDFKEDKEVVLAAVGQSGHALRHAAPSLLHDREFVLDAVSASGDALFVAPEALRSDSEFVFEAAKRGATLGAVPAKFRAEVTRQRQWAQRRLQLLQAMRSGIDSADRVGLLQAVEDAQAHLMPMRDLEEALDVLAQLNKFGDVRSLWEPLKVHADSNHPAVVLVKGTWLVRFSEQGARLPRRQDLPSDAIWHMEDLKREVEEYEYEARKRRPPTIVVVSHCWLRQEHPDPHGEQLKLLARLCQQRIKDLGENTDLAVFVDCCSLFQKPRSADENALYQDSLRSIPLWYAHEKTEKWLLTHTPESCSLPSDLEPLPTERAAAPIEEDGAVGEPAVVEEVAEPTAEPVVEGKDSAEIVAGGVTRVLPFEARGWTCVERAIADLIISEGSAEHSVLDIGKLDVDCELPPWPEIQRRCSTERVPPQLPEVFCEQLAAKAFSDPADVSVVQGIYRTVYAEEVSAAQILLFGGLNWGDREASLVAEALKTCSSVQRVHLDRNGFGNEGVMKLMEALCQCTELEVLHLGSNRIGDLGVDYIASKLHECSKLKVLDVSSNRIGNAGADRLTAMFDRGAHPTLQELVVLGNEVGSYCKRRLIQTVRRVQGHDFIVTT